MSELQKLSSKIFGDPPPKGAPRVKILRWIRGFYFKPAPLFLVVYVMLAIWGSTLTLALAGVAALLWLQGLVSLSLRIRREERAAPKART